MNQEIIFEKSRRNLKMVYDRLQQYSIGRLVGREPVMFVAIAGYGRTYELLLEMGCLPEDIVTFSEVQPSQPYFLNETHNKKVLLVRRLNYTTTSNKGTDYSKRSLDLGVADKFEESLLVYSSANRLIGNKNQKHTWVKPTIVVLEDQALNLQFDGHRFRFVNIGFAQMRNRYADPVEIVKEIKEVEASERMQFTLYQTPSLNEQSIIDALSRINFVKHRVIDGNWYLKPTEYKRAAGSKEVADGLKDISELGITQLKSNKRISGEVARWVVIPEDAFSFNGFDYKDEEDLFNEELELEEKEREEQERRTNEQLHKVMSIKFPFYIKKGYIGNEMEDTGHATLNDFVNSTDGVETEVDALTLLESATTEEEYTEIKKHHLMYFLDGNFQNSIRTDNNYLGGKRLVSIDIDDDTYTREQLEDKLESQDLFGLIYPTPRYYFEGKKHWRIVLLADNPMDKDTYRNTVKGVTDMLDVAFDPASAKISQLMGYPLAFKDISIVAGSTVNVAQFQPRHDLIVNNYTNQRNLTPPTHSSKSLLDFNHQQAKLLNQAFKAGIPEGGRNESYRQMVMFLRDIQTNPQYEHWKQEAYDIEQKLPELMIRDGLQGKEIDLICRP